jgi:hypothetical protein
MMTLGELRDAIEQLLADGADEDVPVRVQIVHGDGNEVLVGGLRDLELNEEDEEEEEFLVLTGNEDELVSSERPVNGPLDLETDDEDEDEDPDSRP